MSFSFFPHTADIGVRLDGRTLDDLFDSAARAFSDTITDPASLESRHTVEVSLESPALDLLLVDWLGELLYRFEVDQFLVASADVHVFAAEPGGAPSAAYRLHATLAGETFHADRHGIKVLVKAITYHALEVKQDADGWHATVVFDI